MKVEHKRVGTVEVCAPLDALADDVTDDFNAVLRTCLAAPNPRVVVDMSEAGYMDSRAVEGLLDVADDLEGRGVQLKLASVTPTCREILELVGVSGRFQFFQDVDSAVRSFL